MTSGSYCLGIQLGEPKTISVGALGEIEFPAGRYLYVGSALSGLEHRVRRHVATSQGRGKAIHWHIDYLLSTPGVELEAVYVIESDERLECRIASDVAKNGSPIPGFGCSDCRCRSHLYRVDSYGFLKRIGLRLYPLT